MSTAVTAAFFANKKNKKAFKFNANLVDVNHIASATHVDAPALSNEQQTTYVEATPSVPQESHDGEHWDDEALAASTSRKAISTAEVLEMKALDPRRNQDNIAEKLQQEETKAQLAAAREKQEQLEREAAKAKEEQQMKEEEQKSAVAPRFGAAAANLGGGKWVPPHMRNVARQPASSSDNVNVQSAEAFPSLAAADQIEEQKKKQSQPKFKASKKTPVGGGASWASKPSPPKPSAKEIEKKEEELMKELTPGTASVAASVRKPLKKKKKDLSTFAPRG